MVYVLDERQRLLEPCTGKRARLLPERGRAVGHKTALFTIRLKDRLVENSLVQPVDLRLEPGSKAAGSGAVRAGGGVAGVYEFCHRSGIKGGMDSPGKGIDQGMAARACRLLPMAGGWPYERRCAALFPPWLKPGASARRFR